VFGAFIQFSGLYAPPSAWIARQPSALIIINRVASGNEAASRPSYVTLQEAMITRIV
jgi:hypothetical protein